MIDKSYTLSNRKEGLDSSIISVSSQDGMNKSKHVLFKQDETINDERPSKQKSCTNQETLKEFANNKRSNYNDVQASQSLLIQAQSTPNKLEVSANEIELAFFPEIDDISLHLARTQPVTISCFESVTNFYAQFCNLINGFDCIFNDFQQYCSSALEKKLTLKSEHVNMPNLALAARFFDNTWYRARISTIFYLKNCILE